MPQPGQGAQIAAQSLFTASAALNAIPVGGQIASGALALVGGLVKLFGGRRRAKKAAARRREQARIASNRQAIQPQANPVSSTLGGAQAPQSIQQQTAFAPNPTPPTFDPNAGSQQPTVQEVPQQNLNEKF